LNQQIQVAELLKDAPRRFGDRNPIRHIELERDGARPNLLGRSLAAPETTRTTSTVTPCATSSFAT
jgi:hypothetical protein